MRYLTILAILVVSVLAVACAPDTPVEPIDDFPQQPAPEPEPMPAPEPAPMPEPVEQQVVATVNGESIYNTDVEQILMSGSMQGVEMTEEDAVEQVAMRILLFQEAMDRGFVISDEQVQNEVEMLVQQQGMDMNMLEEQLAMQGETIDSVYEDVRQQMLLEMLVDDVASDISVTQEEAMQFYEMQVAGQEGAPSFAEVEDQIVMMLQEEHANEALFDLADDLLADADIQMV